MPTLVLDRRRGELLSSLGSGRRKTTLAESLRATEGASSTVRLFVVDSDDAGRLSPVDLTGSGDKPYFRIAAESLVPATGSVSLTFGGSTTAAIQFDRLTAHQIETRLNQVSTVVTAGRVDVEEIRGDGHARAFKIEFREVGARGAITATVAGDSPPVGTTLTVTQEGTGSLPEIVLLTVEPAKVAALETTAWTALSAPTVTISTEATGSASVSSVYRVKVGTTATAEPRAYSFRLIVESATTGQINANASPTDIEGAINTALGSTGAWRVTKLGAHDWRISRRALGVATITVTDSTVDYWPGLTGTLAVDSAGVSSLIAGNSSVKVAGTISSGTMEPLYREVFALWGAIEPNGTTSPLVFARTVTSASDPTTGDDSADGYGLFTLWINTTDDGAFILVDNAEGAAVWTEIASGGSATAVEPEDVIRLGSIPQIVPETHIADHVDRRILGLTANSSTMDIYSTLDNSGSGTYVRNATNWAADIDWTCIAAYNSAAASGVNGGGPTVISPLHGIAANHYAGSYTIGATVRYVTADDVVVSRTIDSVQQVGSTDIQVVKFSSALPATITPAKVLPANYADVLDLVGLPAAKTDKDQNLLVADLDTDYSIVAPSDAQRLTFYEAGVAGDSGSPVFVIIDGAPVMLFGLESSTGVVNGEEIAAQITGINSAMTTLGGGYSLTQVALPASIPMIPWANVTDAPALGTGDVVGPAGGVSNNDVPLYSGTTGKIIKAGYATSIGGDNTAEGKIARFADAGILNTTGLDIYGTGWNVLRAGIWTIYDEEFTNVTTLQFNPSNNGLEFPATTGTLATNEAVAAAYQPLDAQLTSLAGLSYAGNGSKVVRVNAGETAFEFATISGSGDVSKVGTPANDHLGVWTGDGTLEGSSALTFDGSAMKVIGTLELGHATDTTIARTGAGVIAVEGVEITTNSRTQVLTNKTLESPVINNPTITGLAGFLALYPLITGKTGGTATDLDSLTTGAGSPDASINDVILTRTGSGSSANLWWLRAGTDAEDAAGGIVRPDDYATTTNEKVWELIL